jgi:dihydrodipicolinate synthase/N-acetylneuraminate lyase
MVTPWDPERRAPERDVLGRLIDRFTEARVTGLYILGTTGEGTLLSADERESFAEAVLELAAGSISIIVHTGHDRTEVACDLSRHATKIGAAAVAVAAPCRYRFTQAELRAHYLEVASSIGELPLFLYDIPATTGNPLSGELLGELHAEAPNVVGAKISRGDWEAWEEYLELADEVHLLIGKDEMGLPLLSLGGAAKRGDYEEGKRLQMLITELCRVTRRGHVPTIKRALSLLGWEVGPPLPPLRPMPTAEDDVLKAQLTILEGRMAQLIKKGGDSKKQ